MSKIFQHIIKPLRLIYITIFSTKSSKCGIILLTSEMLFSLLWLNGYHIGQCSSVL